MSILLSLWSTNKGTKALFEGLNIAYDEEDKRGFIKKNAITLLVTLCGIVTGVVLLALVTGFPALSGSLGLPDAERTAID